jgi:hypothetical protein
MNQMSYKDAFEMLRRAGFTTQEIDRLYRLRRDYTVSQMDQAPANHRRLEFVRWLVTTGRLSDQIA